MIRTRQPWISALLARLAATATIAAVGFGVAGEPAFAQQFLAGKSEGMNRCVRAILRGYTVKRVNVHGHHFNCHPLKRRTEGRRIIEVDRNRRFQSDDTYAAFFRVNRVGAREIVIPDSVRLRIIRGKHQLESLRPFDFTGPPGVDPSGQDYAYYVRRDRQIRPREESSWRVVADQITTIVIAQLGEPWP